MLRQITKEQREELLQQGRKEDKEGKEDFSQKNRKYFRYLECKGSFET